ncbi:MAG: 1-acyl-sn-glycerol-3-phosphate acyltransferase, partial [Chitinophagaceae bacterium]|nr:1-acyl-sn-glycerol-3-phosphate acyltransferase [Chitinophagaceae bacterium]
KVEMSKVPVFGFIYRKAIVTVNRNSPKDRTKSLLLLRSILRKGISVLVFPEGTFNMTTKPLKSFYDGAFRLAIETQTPVKPVLFLDAYRRMSYKSLFSLTPGICRILYLDEISVDGFSMKEIQALKEKVYEKMEAKLIEYNAGWRKE